MVTVTGTGTVPVSDDRRFCPLCLRWSDAFRVDRNGTPDRGCPQCHSLERHRFLALLLPTLIARADAKVVLDIAPTQMLSALFDRLVPRRVGMDFDPGADGRTVNCRASLTDLPLPDASIDLILCSHVLEHVPDDLAAMRELARVLAPGATGVVAVPQRRGRPTDEDPSASPSERVRRFGQADHVRYYGDDFAERLRSSGLAYDAITPAQLLPAAVVRTCALTPSETFWLVRSAAPDATGRQASSARPGIVLEDLGAAALGELMRLLAAADANHTIASSQDRTLLVRAEQRRQRAVASALRTRTQYEQLIGRPPMRVALLVWRGIRRVRARTRR